MKKKWILTILSCLAAVCILAGASIPLSRHIRLNRAEKALWNSYYTMPEGYMITASNGAYETENNSLSYIRSVLDGNANCLQVDVVFNEASVPYVCGSMDNIAENTVPLEYVFKLISSTDTYKDFSVALHLIQAENLTEIEKLAEKYGMLDKVFYIGVNSRQAEFVASRSTKIGFYVDYEIDKSKLSDETYVNQIFLEISNTGAIGLNCKTEDVNDKLCEMLKENWMKLSFYDVDDDLSMFTALSFSPDQIITSNPEKLQELIFEWQEKAPVEYYGISTTNPNQK